MRMATMPKASRRTIGSGWVLWDEAVDGPYLQRAWPTEDEARGERETLLRGYPPGCEWDQRLTLRRIAND
jgi:hypothetical protein